MICSRRSYELTLNRQANIRLDQNKNERVGKPNLSSVFLPPSEDAVLAITVSHKDFNLLAL